MKKEYNFRNKKKVSAVPPPDEESEEESEYTTTSNESTESEISSEETNSDDSEEDEESSKDPVNLNITFTLSKDEYEDESDDDSSSDEEDPVQNMQKQKEVLDKLLELKNTYKDLPIISDISTLHSKETKKYEKNKLKLEEQRKEVVTNHILIIQIALKIMQKLY